MWIPKAMTLTEIGEKYGVHKSTVFKIVKNRQQVERPKLHLVSSLIESKQELAKWRT